MFMYLVGCEKGSIRPIFKTIRSSHNSAYFKKRFLNNFNSCLEYKSVSFTMAYTPCFEEENLDIRKQSGCLCVTSFLMAGHYCRKMPVRGLYTIRKFHVPF